MWLGVHKWWYLELNPNFVFRNHFWQGTLFGLRRLYEMLEIGFKVNNWLLVPSQKVLQRLSKDLVQA